MRNSGRTSIMLHRAVANALEGKDVMVVAATKEQACQMFKRVADMQTPQKAHYPRLVLEYGEGRMRFVANTRDQVNERGFSGIIATDHYVLESLVQDHGPRVDTRSDLGLGARRHSCNRHDDCDEAESKLLAKNPGMKKTDISLSFHCHNEECEDCFGC